VTVRLTYMTRTSHGKYGFIISGRIGVELDVVESLACAM